MNKFIINKKEDILFKNMLFEKDRILATGKNFGSESAFRQQMALGKTDKSDTHLIVSYSDIQKVIPFEGEHIIQIFYDDEKAGFDLDNVVDYQEVLNHILNQKSLTPSTEKVGNTGAVVKPALYTLAAAIFSGVLVAMAATLESGASVTISGGRRGMKKMLVGLAETLGLWGSMALGLVVTGGFVYYTIKQYKASKIEITVYK